MKLTDLPEIIFHARRTHEITALDKIQILPDLKEATGIPLYASEADAVKAASARGTDTDEDILVYQIRTSKLYTRKVYQVLGDTHVLYPERIPADAILNFHTVNPLGQPTQ